MPLQDFNKKITDRLSRLLTLIPGIFIFLITSCTSNQQSFRQFMGFNPGKDVKNINIYADEWGIDASYWLAFECHDSTVKKIATSLKLKPEPSATRGLFGGLNSEPAAWWDTTFIFHAKPLSRRQDQQFWFLWYDTTTRKAYFLTLDI
ncbi:hypothetical protein HB364_26965 [Pseudoflavitalea sp. X16]|uniref:hypothetical protein n=1 Tax=Paraflavitalea devenefica TaxID=2716334 RepID=UPI001422413C|nr:hypothetical protein [Paraflavitalea devenefica]NII28752.1 hypothetical protein [Paraflavitalea devenefica]